MDNKKQNLKTVFSHICLLLTFAWAFLLSLSCARVHESYIDSKERVQSYTGNSYYWQYKVKPVFLIGGSWQDNLFNHPSGLEDHLDLMTSVGGNYVRNVMSHRNLGNVFAYSRSEDGIFDLTSLMMNTVFI